MIVEEKKVVPKKHSLVLENKEKLLVTGVNDVMTFDEETIIVDTEKGLITFRGNNLHINKLNLDKGELEVDGEIESLNYSDNYKKSKGSIFKKIFK